MGGKDAASARYIFTRLEDINTRSLFHVHDDPLLAYMEEDGQRIEPSTTAASSHRARTSSEYGIFFYIQSSPSPLPDLDAAR